MVLPEVAVAAEVEVVEDVKDPIRTGPHHLEVKDLDTFGVSFFIMTEHHIHGGIVTMGHGVVGTRGIKRLGKKQTENTLC